MCRSVLSWTALISTHSNSGNGHQALRLHRFMLDDGFQPNSYTYLALLKACGSTANLAEGVRFHTEACKKGYASDLYLASSLVSMYSKCGVAMEAESVFGAMGNRSVVSWNAMLSAYVENGRAEEALRLYRQMQEEEEGRSADGWSFVASIQACGALAGCGGGGEGGGGRRRMRAAAMEIGQALHADARRRGYAGVSRVGNTVVSMYGRCKALGEAGSAFAQLRVRSTVSWNAMLSACVECGHGRRALQLLREMLLVQEEGAEADAATILIGCRACKALLEEEEDEEEEEEEGEEVREGEGPMMKRRTPMVVVVVAEIGRALHKDATRMGQSSNVLVANALLVVYSKCGEIGAAEAAFDSLGAQANEVSWATIVSMYVRHGLGDKALTMCNDMQRTGRWHCGGNRAVLDGAMVVSMLGACASMGALGRCREMHFGVVSGGIEIEPYAGSALVHAYGSCASTADADSAILGLLQPSVAAWNSQMASHALGGGEIASTFFGAALEELILTGLQPTEATLSVLVQACSHSGAVSQALVFWERWNRAFGPGPSAIVLDLLGRAGDFRRLEDAVRRMPTCPDLRVAWSSLLNACRIYGNLDLAVDVFGRASRSSAIDGSPYVLMSDILALR